MVYFARKDRNDMLTKLVSTYNSKTHGYMSHMEGNFGGCQGKISCKILDTLQEKGHFLCKILAPCKFLTRFLLLAKNYARNVKFLAQFLQVLQVSCKKGDISSAHSVHRTCKHLHANIGKFGKKSSNHQFFSH